MLLSMLSRAHLGVQRAPHDVGLRPFLAHPLFQVSELLYKLQIAVPVKRVVISRASSLDFTLDPSWSFLWTGFEPIGALGLF